MAEESKWVVYTALAGNVLVAASKFTAAAFSHSTAMLTEAIHSSADCANQVLLLIGTARSKKEPDRGHPFGYDGEIYFWAFVVAVMVLLLGGATSIYQGIREFQHPHPVEAPVWSFTVLALSAVFEAGSFVVGYRLSRRMIRRHPGSKPVSIWRFIELSKDPNMYESLLEDGAALIGIAIAAIGVLGNVVFGVLWMDAAASIAIGVLLIANSYVIAYATRSLVAGEAVAPAVGKEIERALKHVTPDARLSDVKSLHLGPDTIIVTVAVDAGKKPADVPIAQHLAAMEHEIKKVDERIRHVFFTLK